MAVILVFGELQQLALVAVSIKLVAANQICWPLIGCMPIVTSQDGIYIPHVYTNSVVRQK